jgi:hypothetical protein
MTFTANQVLKIIVKDRNGFTKGELQGKVAFRGGDGILLESDRDEITINAGSQYSEQDDRYQRKFETVINGGTFVDDDGTIMTFSGVPYYISKIGNVAGDFLQNFDFLCNACGQVGIARPTDDSILLSDSSSAENQSSLSGTSSESEISSLSESSGGIVQDQYALLLNEDGELELLDICQACIDCADYAQVVTLMERIEEFQQLDVSRNLDSGQRLYSQFQATMHFWNYLVHQKCLPIVRIKGNEFFFTVKSGYMNKGDGPYTATQTYTINVTWEDEEGDLCIDITDTKMTPSDLPDPTIEVNKINDTQWEVIVEHPELEYSEKSLYEMAVVADLPMSDYDFEVTWTDTHLGVPVTKDDEGRII